MAVEAGRREQYHAAIVLGAGLLLRAGLIQAYPQIFGDDSVTRLVYHDRILIAHALPALQTLVFLVSKISLDPMVARYAIAVIGAVAGLGFYYLAADLLGRPGGFAAALLFATNPFIVAQSTVPYTEILMLAGLFFAFHFYFQGKWLAASVALGLASLSRYEAWAAGAVLAVAFAWTRGRHPVEWLKGVLLFGWALLAWIICNRGISPPGTSVLELAFSLERLMRHVYLGWITVKFTPVVVSLLAVLGLWRIWEERLLLAPRLRLLAVFFALFLLAILFSAHGDPRDKERFVTAREAHTPIAAVILLAGFGLPRDRRVRTALVAAGVVFGVIGAARYVAREVSAPAVQLGYQLARYLDGAMPAGESALILVKPFPPQPVQAYLERFERKQGAEGRRDAQKVIEATGDSAPDYQRVAGQSRVVRKRLRTLTSAAISSPRHEAQVNADLPEWVIVWSDFEPSDAGEARLLQAARDAGPPLTTLRAGTLAADVYRIRR